MEGSFGTGAVPSRRWLAARWFAAAVAVAAVLTIARVHRTPGDDPDPGRQRPGILDLAPLPERAPNLDGIDLPDGRPAVVFFAAADRAADLCSALRHARLPASVHVVVAVDEVQEGCPARTTGVDVSAAAAAFGLPRPRGDVVPTGYAIVDDEGRIRYRTLDPFAPELLDEVATMLRGLR